MTGMMGRLRLVAGLDASGRCSLREQFSTQLQRVLQLVPGDVPQEGILYVVNPTGGVLEGDVLEAEIRVESGAHAIVTAPSATKIHRMEARPAESRTRLDVAQGAVLEYLPEPIIPFSGSRYIENLSIDVSEGGRLLAWEIVAPGRAARGELFKYDLLGLRLEAREEGRVILRERALLAPRGEPFPRLAMGEGTHYGVLLAIGGGDSKMEAAVREAAGGPRAGVSRLRGTGLLVKAVAGSSSELEGLFQGVRRAVLPGWTGRPATPLRPI
jgi:urease accessory protein